MRGCLSQNINPIYMDSTTKAYQLCSTANVLSSVKM